MPLIPLFADGFDHYTDIVSKWDFNGTDCQISRAPGTPRTGPGCLSITSSAFGPIKTFGRITDLLVGLAWNSPGTPSAPLAFINYDLFPGTAFQTVGLNMGGNGAVNVVRNPRFPQGTIASSAAGVVKFGVYNSIVFRAEASTTGRVRVWVNGVKVLDGVGDTTDGNPTQAYWNAFQLMGLSGNNQAFVDDVYALDCTTADPGFDFPGNVRVFESVATANGAPLIWTPSAGTNFSNTTEVPPDDDGSFNSSGNVGDADQYVYLAANVPGNGSILFVQHTMDMRIDSGARSVASSVGGALTGPPSALTTGYKMYPTPYLNNPLTGLPWVPGDFPAQFGPKVTA
jgi:hypothetical protein